MKRCAKCKEIKPLCDFHKRVASTDGLRHSCKKCISDSHRTWRLSNLDESKARSREWNRVNPDKVKAVNKAWREANSDKLKVAKKAYREANHDKELAYQRLYRSTHVNIGDSWRKANPDKLKSNLKVWRLANPGQTNALNAKRRTTKLRATPPWLSKEQCIEIQQFYIDAKELQWLSDLTDPLQVDHIVPLQGKNVSGLHVPWNLQIIPRSQNIKKRNKLQ